MTTVEFSKLRSIVQKHSSFYWIFINTLGYYIINNNVVGQYLQKIHIAPYLMLVYAFVISPVVSGLFFGLIQLGYMKIINRELFIRHWSLMTSLSFFLINLINSYLALFLSQIIYKTTDINFPSTSNIFTGNVIGGEMDLSIKILIVAFMGIAMGIVSGLALGLFPSFSIMNKEIKREWIRRVIISMCISFVVNSIFYTVAYDRNLLGRHLGSLYTFGLLFTGFIYGASTRNTIKKLITGGLNPS